MTTAGNFARNVVLTFMTRSVATLSGVVLVVAAARLLGPTGKGEYTYLITVVGLGTQLGALGVGTANLYYASRDPTATGRLLTISAGAAAIVATVYFLLLWSLSIADFRLVPYSLLETVLIASAVAVGLLWLHSQNVLVGVGEVVRFNLLALLYSAIVLAGTVAAFWYMPGNIGAVVAALLIGGTVVIASLWNHVIRQRGLRAEFDADLARRVLKYGFTIYISHAIAFLLVKIDLLLVQYYLGSRELGLYSAAGDFLQAIVQLQAVVNMLVFPKLAALASEDERRRITKRIARRAIGVYVVGIVGLALGSDFVVRVVFGNEFVAVAAVLVWLLPAAAALAIASIFQNHIGAAGRPIDMALAPSVALVAQTILCTLLIPQYGIVGAAVSSCVSFTLMAIVAAFKAFRAERRGTPT